MIAVQEDRCCGTVARSGRAGSLHRWAVGGVLVATLLFSALLSAPAASARDGTVDFSWIAIPTNFVELRSLREELKLPPLLVETCDPDIPRDAPGTFGEDYMTGLVAEVALSPGVAFGEQGDGHVRIALVENEQRIRQAARNIRRFLETGPEKLHNVVPLATRR